jgi:hypothetical protein
MAVVREAVRLDISHMPELVQLAEEVARTGVPRALERDGRTVATLLPSGRQRSRSRTTQLVDTSHLPRTPYRTVDELIAGRPKWEGRAFTDAEIKTALEEERVEAWRRKSS